MKRFLVTCVLIMGVVMIAPSMASAQATGATDVDITLPNIVILHYFSTVSISINATELGTFLTGTGGNSSVDEGAAGGTGLTVDLGMAPTLGLTGDPAAVLLTLQNAWAVRSLSTGGASSTTLTVANTNDTLAHGTSGSIVVNTVAVADGTSNGPAISFVSPGLVSPLYGDVELNLNLNTAIYSGIYTGGVYTLTATVI